MILHLASRICESMAEVDDNILITPLLEHSSVLSWYARPKMLVPNEEQQATMAIEAQLMTSTVRNNEDYLSKGFRHGPAGIGRDIFLFPVRNKRTRV